MKCSCTLQSFGKAQGEDRSWFTLSPCSHSICIDCFARLSAERGCNSYFQCPVCKADTREWQVARVKETTILEKVQVGRQTRQSGAIKMVSVERIALEETHSDLHIIKTPNLQSEPTQYHKNLVETLRKESSIISLVIPAPGANNKSMTLSTEIFGLGKGIDEVCSDEAKDNLEKIFQFLHSKLLTGFTNNLTGYEQFGATYGGRNLDEIINSDKSTLLRCVYALATGDTLKKIKAGTLWTNQKASAFAATDIIRNLATKTNSGALKTLIGHQLLAYTIPHALHKILNKFGVCPSHQYNRISDIRSGEDTLIQGLLTEMIDPHDLWLVLYDNIGFRRCGSKPGWDQFIALQLVRIPKEVLKNWGLYPDPLIPRQEQELLSWDNGNEWEEIRGNVDYKDVFGTDKEDVSNLANIVLTPIEVLLEMEIKKELPTLDECRNLAKLGGKFAWPKAIPKDKKKMSVVEKDTASDFATAQVHVGDDGDEDEIDLTAIDEEDIGAGERDDAATAKAVKQKFETNYDANNAIVDRPMEMDLNSKKACKVLMEYGNQLLKKVQAQEVLDNSWQPVERVMDKYGVALLGDGNPSHMILNILQEAESDDDVCTNTKAFTGGFHMILEAHRKRGGLFGKSHLEDFFSCWRTSVGQLNWVMNPGDPGQIDAELSMYILALYVAAIRAVIETKRLEFESSAAPVQQEEIKICAIDIVDFMLARARKYPIVMVILLEMRFAEVIFMLHNAEQDADETLYLTALKYLAPLFAATHATKYVELLAKFLVEWHCMSDAEKAIFAKGIFTRKTKNGRNVWSDRFVEWMMRDLRMWCSNVATPHTSSILERNALGLNRKKKAKTFGMRELDKNGNDEEDEEGEEEEDTTSTHDKQINHVFCEVIIFCAEANIFGPGDIKHIRKGPASKFTDPGERDKGTTMKEMDVGAFSQICDAYAYLNTELPQARKIGEERMTEYFDHYFKIGDLGDASRSEKDGVALPSISPLLVENAKGLREELVRCISTDIKVIEEHYIVDELNVEIDELNDLLHDSPNAQIQKDGGEKKLDLCYLVKRLRLNLLRVNPTWAAERETNAKGKLDEHLNLSATNLMQFIDDELKNPFYTLQSTTRQDDRDNHKYFTLPFGGAERNTRIRLDDDNDEDPIQYDNSRRSYGLSSNAWL